MRLRLTATPEELETKGGDLIKALAKRLEDYDLELGEALIKAAKVKDPDSKAAADNLQFRVLREIKAATTKEYKRQLQGMLEDIDGVLNGKLRKAFGDPPEEKEPGEEEEEPLEPGDYDPKTDTIVPEPEEEDEEDEEEEEEKSLIQFKPQPTEGANTIRLTEADESCC